MSWLWQVSGEAGSGDLARPSWLYEFLQKENAKKNVRPSATKCVKKMKMDFGRRRLWWAWSGKPNLKSACFWNNSFYNRKRNFIFKTPIFTMNSTPRHWNLRIWGARGSASRFLGSHCRCALPRNHLPALPAWRQLFHTSSQAVNLENSARLEFQRRANRAWQTSSNATCHIVFCIFSVHQKNTWNCPNGVPY